MIVQLHTVYAISKILKDISLPEHSMTKIKVAKKLKQILQNSGRHGIKVQSFRKFVRQKTNIDMLSNIPNTYPLTLKVLNVAKNE